MSSQAGACGAQLVLYRHAHFAGAAARGDVRAFTASVAKSTTSPTTAGRRPRLSACAKLEQWRADIAAMVAGQAPLHLAALAEADAQLSFEARGFRRRDRRHGDGRRARTSALRTGRRWTSIATGWRPPSGGFRCAFSAWPTNAGVALAHHLGRALQLTNILRDIDEDAGIGRLYLPREALHGCGRDDRRTAGRRCGPEARPGLRRGGGARSRAFRRRRNRSWSRRRARR